MRTIVQQLLRGKPVEMSEEAKKKPKKKKRNIYLFCRNSVRY